jgi:hypothetical protein
MMTPRLAEALAALCDADEVEMNLRTLEELQDFVLAATGPGKEADALGWLSFLRSLRSLFVCLREAKQEEGGDGL